MPEWSLPLPVPDGYTECFYGLSLAGDTELMGTSLAWATGAGVPAEEDVLGHYNRFANAFKARIPNVYSFPVIRTTTGTGTGDFTQEVAADPAIVGTAGAGALPNNCAVLIAKITAAGGRRNRGRMFFPGITESAVDHAGLITTAERNLWQTAIDTWSDGEETLGFGVPALLHQTGSSSPTTITSFVVRTRIATQRRRMRP